MALRTLTLLSGFIFLVCGICIAFFDINVTIFTLDHHYGWVLIGLGTLTIPITFMLSFRYGC